MPPILEVSGLSYSYHTISGETKALSDISFQVETGEFIAIVGPSGCGKSTLLSLISGLLPPEEGSILINGVPLSKSQCRIGYMLQSDQLFEWRTIIQNAALGLEIQKKMDHAAEDRLHRLLKIYGLEQFEHSRPSELSGGMRQRAALIRTLALEPGASASRRTIFGARLSDTLNRLRRYQHHHPGEPQNSDSDHPRPLRSRECRRPHPGSD